MASTAPSRLVDEEAGDAVLDQFGHGSPIAGDHGGAAGHGLDHGEAKGLVEIDQMEERARRPQHPRASLATDRTVVDDTFAVDCGCDPALVIGLILNDTRHHQAAPGSLRSFDGLGCALVGMDATEEQEVFAAARVERKLVERDSVMDRGCVAELRMAIGRADRDVGDAVLVALEDRHDAFGRQAVDGRDDRGFDQTRETERHEVGLVVNEIELTGALEDVSDVQELPDLGIDGRVLGVRMRTDAGEGPAREGVGGGKQGDVDAASDEGLGEQARDELPGAIVAWRGAPRDRRQHGDTQGMPSFRLAMVGRG